MIKVLIAEDSLVVQELLIHILSSDPEIHIIGTANNGEEVLEVMRHKKPDVITMDINMPKMNGFEATRRIMEAHPTPIVIVSGNWNPKEVETTFRAMEMGALAILQKPMGIGHTDHDGLAKELVQTVKLMSEVKVVKRWAHPQRETIVPAVPSPVEMEYNRKPAEIKLVAIGASTGGPPVLQTVLSELPKGFSVSVLIVQHIATGFTQGLVEWLDQSSAIPVHIAAHDELLSPGHAYVAPDGFHLGVNMGGQIALSKDAPENGLCPSVSYLFRSVAKVFGKNAVCVLLTGMGKDGAEELRLMKEKGAITIAQDKESSVVHGMPGEAIRLDAAMYVLSADKIAEKLTSLMK